VKTLLKFLAVAALLAILLPVVAHFALRAYVNSDAFKASLGRAVHEKTGRDVQVGRIDYTLLPPSLVVRDAAIKEADGSADFASMREFSVFVDLRAREVTSVLLREPTIRVVQYADGRFNFSDLLPPEPEPSSAPGDAPSPEPAPAPEASPAPAPPSTPPELPLVLRLVEIENARFEFAAVRPNGTRDAFTLSDLGFKLVDFSFDRPVRIEGSVKIGASSSFGFTLAGPPLAPYAGRLEAWPLELDARLDVADFADLKLFLPADALPFRSLLATLSVRGAPAETLAATLDVETPAAAPEHPVAIDAQLRAELSVPGPVLAHLASGAPLPEDLRYAPRPCAPPPGTLSLADNAAAALLLRHLRATLDLTFPAIDYGQNRFANGALRATLHNGMLDLPSASLQAYGGSLALRANAQLLACPLAYQVEMIEAKDVSIRDALDANGIHALSNLYGTINFLADLSGQAVAEPALRTALQADATLRVEDLRSVGAGGSLLDQVWLKLDNPVLLKLVPRIQPKVEQARLRQSTVSTSRYDDVTATLSLRDGVAVLSDARLALPGYAFEIDGSIHPFDDRVDLKARLLVSPEETAALTDGKDRSAYLPYVDGGLMIPLAIRGPLEKPVPLPDLDVLLRNALAGGALADELSPHLEKLSEKDRQIVGQGLQLLQGLGRRPKGVSP
jgi:hypothetical protein